jgi:hypothetical protein
VSDSVESSPLVQQVSEGPQLNSSNCAGPPLLVQPHSSCAATAIPKSEDPSAEGPPRDPVVVIRTAPPSPVVPQAAAARAGPPQSITVKPAQRPSPCSAEAVLPRLKSVVCVPEVVAREAATEARRTASSYKEALLGFPG